MSVVDIAFLGKGDLSGQDENPAAVRNGILIEAITAQSSDALDLQRRGRASR